MPRGYIDDGFTVRGYVKAQAGFHQALDFSFRPALDEERMGELKVREGEDQVGFNKRVEKFVAKCLETWDLKDKNGDAVPVSAEAVKRLWRPLKLRLTAIVLGTEPSDINPAWDDETIKQSNEGEGTTVKN